MSRPWNLPESAATPAAALLSRRQVLKALGIGAGVAAVGGGLLWWYQPGTDQEVLSGGDVGNAGDGHYPAARNAKFAAVDRPETAEAAAARWCNFYEFSSSKDVWRYVEPFQPLPWKLEVTGLVARPRTYDVDDLLRQYPLEERVYRHRCVEAWAMVVPWTGFALAEVLRKAEPLPEARFVRFVTFDRPEQAGRQKNRGYPWPYTEGLTLAEATNE